MNASLVLSWIRWLLFFVPFLLPFARYKITLLGLPLYTPEIPISVALGLAVYAGVKGSHRASERAKLPVGFVVGASLFLLGGALSLLGNPVTLTGLGMFKSWFVFPTIFFLLWRYAEASQENGNTLLFSWFSSVLLVSFLGIGYFLWGDLTYDGRLTAWYPSPNFLAMFIGSGLVISAQYLFAVRIWWRGRKLWAAYGGLIFGGLMNAFALFQTHSYGVWGSVILALMVAWLLVFFAQSKNNIVWEHISFLLLLVVLVFGFGVFEHQQPKWLAVTEGVVRSSLASREMIWKTAWRIALDHPLIGIGVGRFQTVYLDYQRFYPPYLEWAVPQPHNLLLAVWLQTGFLGLAGVSLIVFSVGKALLVNIRQARRGISPPVLFSLLILYLGCGLTDTSYFATDLAYIWAFIIALGAHFLEKRKNISLNEGYVSGE